VIETGIVVGRREDGKALVEVRRTAACDGCHARGACMTTFQDRSTIFSAEDPLGVRPGQRVTLEMADGAFLGACALAYVVPLIGLVVGGVAAWIVAAPVSGPAREVLAAFGSLAGAALAYVGVRLWDRARIRRVPAGGLPPDGSFHVRITGRVA
jgi:sigma-E factor negative regulatory protein RseC